MEATPTILLLTLLCCTMQTTLGATVDQANASVSAAFQAAQGAQSTVSGLSKGARDTPSEAEVIKSCVENISDGADHLASSLKEFPLITGTEAGIHLDNVKTWTSAALTYFDTCADGAKELDVNPSLRTKLEGSVSKVEKLTSEALGLVNLIQL